MNGAEQHSELLRAKRLEFSTAHVVVSWDYSLISLQSRSLNQSAKAAARACREGNHVYIQKRRIERCTI
jgi:hypothetical protein